MIEPPIAWELVYQRPELQPLEGSSFHNAIVIDSEPEGDLVLTRPIPHPSKKRARGEDFGEKPVAKKGKYYEVGRYDGMYQ